MTLRGALGIPVRHGRARGAGEASPQHDTTYAGILAVNLL
jgi:hypothetical protein